MAKRQRITVYNEATEKLASCVNGEVKQVKLQPVAEKVSYFFGKKEVRKVYSTIKSKE